MSGYVGLPKPTDVAAQLRLHAQKVADGTETRPTRAVLVSFDAEGKPDIHTFGPPYLSHREAIADLVDVVAYLNSQAAN